MRNLSLPGAALCVLSGCGHEADHSGHGGDPRTVPIAPIQHDALFVVNGASNSISVIDTSSETVVGEIRIENATFPHHINLSPDGSRVVVALPGSDLSGGHGGHGAAAGALLVLDATTGATLAARTLEASNHNGLFASDGSEIWTSQMRAPGSVLVLDAGSLAHAGSVPVGDMPAEVTRPLAGGNIFVTNTTSNNVTVVDPSSKEVVDTIPVGAGPVGAWPGNDNIMYVDSEGGRSVTAIDASSLAVVRTYALGFVPGMAATAPNSELWVTDATSGRVVFYSPGSTTVTGEVATGAGAHAIVFSGDGAKAYISNQTAGTVSVVDVATRAVSSTISVGSKPNGMLFRAY